MAAAVSTIAPSASSAAVLAVKPFHLNFEVGEVEALARKVHGATQYLFKDVEFFPCGNSGPSGIPVTEDQKFKTKIDIPVHAPTLEDALAILQAYGESIKSKTVSDFHQIMEDLKYSAVDLTNMDPDGSYKLSFREYDSKTSKYKKPHIETKITAEIDKGLQEYAKLLGKSHPSLGKVPAVNPHVSLAQSGQASTHVDVKLSRADPLKDAIGAIDQFVKDTDISSDKSGKEDAVKKAIEQFDSKFGSEFSKKVIEKGLDQSKLYQHLCDEIFIWCCKKGKEEDNEYINLMKSEYEKEDINSEQKFKEMISILTIEWL